MTGSVRKMTLLTACGLAAAASARATTPQPPVPSDCTVPCAIVLVGNNVTDTAADTYGVFTVYVANASGAIGGSLVTVDFTGCCPDIKLSNTQLGLPPISYTLPMGFLPAGTAGTHTANAAFVTGLTDATGYVTFIIQGAAGQGVGDNTGLVCTSPAGCGCATITATASGGGTSYPIASGVFVSTPDENGAVGSAGVEVTDLAVYIADKYLYFKSNNSIYRQRSDFDFHLPVYACSAVFDPSFGLGDNLGDLIEWKAIKNAFGSAHNGPFPAACP